MFLLLDQKLNTDIKEIRIFSRDEKKQHDMRVALNNPKVKFYISTNTKLDKAENYKKVSAELDEKIKSILAELNLG